MNKNLKSISVMSFVILGMLGISLINMPYETVIYAKTTAWLCPIIIGSISIFFINIVYWIHNQYPVMNFAQLNEAVLGKYLGKFLLIIISIYNFLTMSLYLRIFAESINIFLLEKTPILLVMLIMLTAIYYCITRDIKSISIIFDLLLPFVLIFIGLLVMLGLTAADYKNLLPIWNTDAKSFIKGCYYVMAPISAGYIYAFLFPHFNDYKDTKRYVIFSFGIATLIYSIIIMLCIMVFGDLEITYLIFPTLTLSKSIQLDNQIFERAESLFMAAWIPNTFTTLVVHYLLSTISLKTALNIKKPKFVNLLMFPMILFIAYLPQNTSEVFKYNDYINIASVMLTFVYFPIFAFVAFLKYRLKRKKQSSE